jgi:xanthine dehydrogenase accessory factor
MTLYTFIRGGGDLASGVALRLFRAGVRVLIAELEQPLVVRRLASFAETVYRGEFAIEEASSLLAQDLPQALSFLETGIIPVMVDPGGNSLSTLRTRISHRERTILVDARMLKRAPDLGLDSADFVIGLGPGFYAGENCHAVIETKRGHFMGRVIWTGMAEADSGVPEGVAGHGADRVLRAPAGGVFNPLVEIGAHLEAGEPVAQIGGQVITAPFSGRLRGLLHSGLTVEAGMKVGDVDPRDDPRTCTLVSDKSLAIGGGVLEAILTRPELRAFLCQ